MLLNIKLLANSEYKILTMKQLQELLHNIFLITPEGGMKP